MVGRILVGGRSDKQAAAAAAVVKMIASNGTPQLLHVPGILNPNTGGKILYGKLSVHISAPILNSDSNVRVQYAWDV